MKTAKGEKMKRNHAVLIGIAFITVLWTVQPALAIDVRPYFPLAVGTARLVSDTITRNGSSREGTSLTIITRTEQVGGKTVSHLSHGWNGFNPNLPQFVDAYELMAWEGQGLMFYKEVDFDDGQQEVIDYTNNPLLIIPSDMQIGRTYSSALGIFKLLGQENVTVPAGTFQATLKIQHQNEEEGGTCTGTGWYALGIGLIKEVVNCDTSEGTSAESSELIAARSGDMLYGNPVKDGRVVSFALSTVQASGCHILIDGIAIEGVSQLWWGAFRLNPQTLAFELYDAGVGTKVLDQTGCPGLPGIDFDASQPAIWDHSKGYYQTAAFFDRVQLGGQTFLAQFDFSLSQLAFLLDAVWTSGGQVVF